MRVEVAGGEDTTKRRVKEVDVGEENDGWIDAARWGRDRPDAAKATAHGGGGAIVRGCRGLEGYGAVSVRGVGVKESKA